jgi:hypothetical protein
MPFGRRVGSTSRGLRSWKRGSAERRSSSTGKALRSCARSGALSTAGGRRSRSAGATSTSCSRAARTQSCSATRSAADGSRRRPDSLASPAARWWCGARGDSIAIRPRKAPCRQRAEAAAKAGSAGRERLPSGGARSDDCDAESERRREHEQHCHRDCQSLHAHSFRVERRRSCNVRGDTSVTPRARARRARPSDRPAPRGRGPTRASAAPCPGRTEWCPRFRAPARGRSRP